MKKLRLDTETLEVAQFAVTEAQPVASPAVMTGLTGFCNTCYSACDWTV